MKFLFFSSTMDKTAILTQVAFETITNELN